MEAEQGFNISNGIALKPNEEMGRSYSKKSAPSYDKEYRLFCEWKRKNQLKKVNEDVMLAYMLNLSNKKLSSSTLWTKYSMVKSMLLIHKNLDISCFSKVTTFLKQQSIGYQPIHSKTFTEDEVNRFMREARNEQYLLTKVVAMIGIAGSCYRDELRAMSFDDVQDTGSQLVVTIRRTETKRKRVFTVTNEMEGVNFLQLFRGYIRLRPENLAHNMLFVGYRNGKCTSQRLGVHSIGGMPKKIAEFLGLADPEKYTGHCFRRTSATLRANADGQNCKRREGECTQCYVVCPEVNLQPPKVCRRIGNYSIFPNVVGKYKRKSSRQSWREVDMKEAMKAVQNRDMGWLAASKKYGVPQATLRRRAQGRNKRITGSAKGLGGYGPIFSIELERVIVDHIKKLETGTFGLTSTEVRMLAFEFAERNKIPHRFNTTKKMAGWDWLQGFRARNPDVPLRTPEATSVVRAQVFNKPHVNFFFEILESTIAEHRISFDRIYNVDEFALSTVQRPQKILDTKGRKQIGAISSAERGTHSTVVCCMNAVGNYIPPTFIFARKKWKSELIDDAPVGTLGLCQESGWMTGELFSVWLEHFIKYSHSSQNNKTLLLLDRYANHKHLNALLLAKENGVVMLCIPPHCTHRLQPLDVSFFGPLSTFYNQAVTRWLKNNPGRTVSQYQVGKLFTEAYERSATMENSVSGFKQTGIHPFNANIFPDWMFAASSTTDCSEQNNTEDLSFQPPQTPPPEVIPIVQKEDKNDNLDSSRISVESVIPIPKASTSYKRQNRKRQGTAVLISTPKLEELKVKAEDTKNLTAEETEEDMEGPFCGFADDVDGSCIYCSGLYSQTKPGDLWLRCESCKRWTHAECADVSPRLKHFICELCC